MTWGDIQVQVKLRLSPSAVANTLVDTHISKWQETRRNQIMNRKNWWFMRVPASISLTGSLTPASSVRSYSLPSDFKDEEAFWLEFTNPSDIKVLPIRSFWEVLRTYTPDDVDEPEIVTMGAGYISLWPKPDKSYTLKLSYYAWPKIYTGGAASTDTDQISLQYPDLYILSLTADGFHMTQEYDKADYWEAQFLGLIGDDNRKIVGSLELEHNMRMLSADQTFEVHTRYPTRRAGTANKWRFRGLNYP